MRTFLKLIEENTPDLNLDEKRAAKRAVQRCLMKKDIKCDANQLSEDIMIHLPDGRIVKLEVKEFVEGEEKRAVEDQEMVATGPAGNIAKLGNAMKSAESIVSGMDPKKRALAFSQPKKNLQKAVGTVYNRVASNLTKLARDIGRG